MKLKLIFIHVFLLSIGLNYTNAQSDSKNDSEKLKARILRACEDLQPTGFAIAIVKDGKTVTEMTWGSKSLEKDQPLKNESLFNIASCTKAASEKKYMKNEKKEKEKRLDQRITGTSPFILKTWILTCIIIKLRFL